MKKRELGKTGLTVSEIGFGCWAIGGDAYGPTSDSESLKALDTAWDHGVDFFDTADTYGKGHSEKLLSQFLKGKPRDKIYIASKAGWDFYHEPVRKRFDTAYLRQACEESLRRLKTDYLDLFQLHNPSLNIIEQGEFERLFQNLKREGKIRFGGLSVHRCEEALAALKKPGVETLQVIFNVLDQRMADEVFQQAAQSKVGIIAREPLASGLLSGKYTLQYEFPKGDHRRRWMPDKRKYDDQKLKHVQEALGASEMSLSQMALSFVLASPEVSTVIPGMKTAAQVLTNLKAEKWLLSQEKTEELRALFQREPVFQQGLNPG